MFDISTSGEIGTAEHYALLKQQLAAVTEGEPDLIANLANISAVLFDQLPHLNWLGFYLMKNGELVLGPFQGKVACVRIPIGKGVCGTAVATGETQWVDDVHAFPGHIACDSASESELVVPIRFEGEVIAVLDIDSPHPARFKETDKQGIENLLPVLESLHWDQV